MTAPTIHIAGPHVQIDDDLRQLCAWCGHRLVDLNLSRVAVPVDQPGPPPTWPVGALVAVDDPASWVVEHDPAAPLPTGTCHEAEGR